VGHGALLVQDNIVEKQLYPEAEKAGISGAHFFLNFVVVKNVIRHHPREDVNGIATFGLGFPFIDGTAHLTTYAHETGHCLMLSTRSGAGVNGRHHDPGMAPNGKPPLMSEINRNRGRWIRQEDWRQANDQAGVKFQ
jgi:hypothetical protein